MNREARRRLTGYGDREARYHNEMERFKTVSFHPGCDGTRIELMRSAIRKQEPDIMTPCIFLNADIRGGAVRHSASVHIPGRDD